MIRYLADSTAIWRLQWDRKLNDVWGMNSTRERSAPVPPSARSFGSPLGAWTSTTG